MKCLSLAVLLLVGLPTALAQERVSRERLRADLEFLTSPPVEGRASLTRGADAAALAAAALVVAARMLDAPAPSTAATPSFDCGGAVPEAASVRVPRRRRT